MQNAAFLALGLNCTYIAFKVTSAELKESIEALRTIKISGFNVTVPHKVSVMKYLDELDSTAKRANAVNTVNNIEGIFKGYNTDIAGFIEPLHRRGIDLGGMKVLLLGAGGAARAVVAALSEELQPQKLVIANRDQARAKELCSIASSLGLKCEIVPFKDLMRFSAESDLIVNATSMGMNGEASPIDQEHIRKGSIVYDIVYRPITTDLLQNARHAQAVVIYGYEMLVEQGARAFEIWTGIRAPRDVMKKSLLGAFGEPA
jgi:shikimate dehydrogenase